MKLSSQFTVPSEPERVFPLFLDADVMRSCIPGCEELVRVDETTFRGRLVSTVAHVRFNAAFSATIQSIDAPRRVNALLKGEDNRLGSSIKIDAVLGVQPHEAGSLVEYEMDMAIWGKIGRLGESIVRRRTAEVEAQFVERFSAAATGELPVPAAQTAEVVPEPAAAGAPAPAPEPVAVAPTAATGTPSAARSDGAPAPARTWWQRLVAAVRRVLRRS